MSVVDRLKMSLGLPKQIKPRRAVKGVIARNYYVDGNLFIERFDILNSSNDSMQNKQFRAKAMVDLCMSLECSMKSLVVSLNHDSKTPKRLMKDLKNLSHHLDKLFDKTTKLSKNRFTLAKLSQSKLNELKKYGVGARYSHDIWAIQTSSAYSVSDDLIEATIDNPIWMNELRNIAVEWNNAASNCYDKYLSKHCIISGNDHKRFERALKKFKVGK
ncbi:TPA: hypothetical protein I7190_27085 [Vibrio vulnificus]|uniref:hypothetical protein n=1 Tax=Vibrio vulnificus TaxID=672 RepID=UPI000D3EDB81|nr:hypothetical protein [Vibrio vulnificus]MBN8106750.1 hypothetical protein [Vibrio vulnificus]PUZ80561.1 hypothetical protein DC360_22275 [Vibrio vulnificus]HAT8521871.1 hypothetical protein [Vibrio vulnificus]HAU8300100.1 hypothetical protein [Vibrio vulnificus]